MVPLLLFLYHSVWGIILCGALCLVKNESSGSTFSFISVSQKTLPNGHDSDVNHWVVKDCYKMYHFCCLWLQDVLKCTDIELDWMFKLSFAYDIVNVSSKIPLDWYVLYVNRARLFPGLVWHCWFTCRGWSTSTRVAWSPMATWNPARVWWTADFRSNSLALDCGSSNTALNTKSSLWKIPNLKVNSSIDHGSRTE